MMDYSQIKTRSWRTDGQAWGTSCPKRSTI